MPLGRCMWKCEPVGCEGFYLRAKQWEFAVVAMDLGFEDVRCWRELMVG